MDQETARIDRFCQGMKVMSPQEQEALRNALKSIRLLPPNCQEIMLDRITEIAQARGRAERKRKSNRITDFQRRTLVGARVPRALKEQCRALKEQCRAQAQARGISLYRFVLDALEQACHNGKGKVSRGDV